MIDTGTTLLNALNNVKETFYDVDFPYGNIQSNTNLDLYYTIDLNKAKLELIIRGTAISLLKSSEGNYISLDGQLVAKLKGEAGEIGYVPQIASELIYANPVIRVEEDRITGLFVNQASAGSIKLAISAQPLRMVTSLDKLTSIPALKNIPIINQQAKSIKVSTDIGSLKLAMPVTGQSNNRLNFDVEVSGGIDAKAKITSKWQVKIAERVKWYKNIALDIPSLQLPIGDLPTVVIEELEPDSSPSYSEQFVWYSFDENSEFIEDKSGNGNHATAVGGVTIENSTAYFNGIDGYIDMPDDIMQTIQDITVYTEVFINETQESPYFIYGLGNIEGDWGNGYLFTTGDYYRTALGLCHWICEQKTGNPDIKLPRGSWQRLVYTLRGNTATVYLNGDVVAINEEMTVAPGQVGDGNTTANFIGKSFYSGDKYLKGAIRDFQILKGALTHKEIIKQFETR
jgi:hypothetical protein